MLMVWVALSLMGCSAVVWPLDISKTVEGINLAAHGAAGTFAYMKAGNPIVVLGWPVSDGKYAFILLDKFSAAVKMSEICNANCIRWDTAAQFLKDIEANGWQSVPAATLPPTLISAVSQAAFQAVLARTGLPSLLVIPGAILDVDPLRMISDGGGA